MGRDEEEDERVVIVWLLGSSLRECMRKWRGKVLQPEEQGFLSLT